MRRLIVFLFLSLTACATTLNSPVEIGNSATTLIQRLGTPNQLIKNSDGTAYYVYTNQTMQGFPLQTTYKNNVLAVGKINVGTAIPVTQPYPNKKPSCFIVFIINNQQVITNIKRSGVGCN